MASRAAGDRSGGGDEREERQPEVALERAWALPAGEVARRLEVAPERGLEAEEIERRRERYGPNSLRAVRSRSLAEILAAQFKSLVVALLAVAAGVSLAFGEWVEAVAIAAVLALNAAIGFVAELKAVRSMEALRSLGRAATRVRRGGKEHRIPADELVPGDVVPLEEGDVVTADLRLLEASLLETDESTLTGESLPVPKLADPVPEDAPLAERPPMLFKGTAVTRGSGLGVVVATGMASELGRIARLSQEAEQEATPLERDLARLGRRLIWATLVVAAVTIAAGLAAGREALLMVETGIALAVAAIPEGLPVVATLALARGMWRMARRNALINRLAAVETLGATTLILTDKTGTLTENRMTVRQLWLPSGRVQVGGEGLELEGVFRDEEGEEVAPARDEALLAALEAGVLCGNASLEPSAAEESGVEALGDPLEVALLVAGVKAGLRRSELLERQPEVREVAFDRATQMMATFHRRDDGVRVAVKGAAERVLEACTAVVKGGERRELTGEEGQRWLERNGEMASDGLRVLGLAAKTAASEGDEPYEELTFLGLVGLQDPPREEVRPTLEACRQAGIRVVMVTGDQAATAVAIARQVGLVEAAAEERAVVGRDLKAFGALSEGERRALRRVPIFARVEPAQKLDLIALHREAGEVVAMTGDGVNDAPALRKADIGVAMGRRGTQVAQEAADMVLRDDSFASIVAAVEQGRAIFANIRRFVTYLLSCNVSEIMIVAGATVLDSPLPILPLQILFLNLVTDVFPALALGLGEAEPAAMRRPPRDRDEPVLARRHWTGIAGFGLLITLSVLGAFFYVLGQPGSSDRRAVTVAFLTLALAQLWHVFAVRDRGSSPWRNQVTRNPWVWGALALCLVLLAAAVYVPLLAGVLGLVAPGVRGWAIAGAASLLPWLVGLFVRSRKPA